MRVKGTGRCAGCGQPSPSARTLLVTDFFSLSFSHCSPACREAVIVRESKLTVKKIIDRCSTLS